MTSEKLNSHFVNLKNFFEVIPLVETPFELSKGEYIEDVSKFVDTHLNILKTYEAYIIRLTKFMEKIENGMHSDLHKLNET